MKPGMLHVGESSLAMAGRFCDYKPGGRPAYLVESLWTFVSGFSGAVMARPVGVIVQSGYGSPRVADFWGRRLVAEQRRRSREWRWQWSMLVS